MSGTKRNEIRLRSIAVECERKPSINFIPRMRRFTSSLILYGEHLREIFLYGSYAKDQADDESDIDIMILIDIEDDHIREYDKELTKVESDIGYKYMKQLCRYIKSGKRAIMMISILLLKKMLKNSEAEHTARK